MRVCVRRPSVVCGLNCVRNRFGWISFKFNKWMPFVNTPAWFINMILWGPMAVEIFKLYFTYSSFLCQLGETFIKLVEFLKRICPGPVTC